MATATATGPLRRLARWSGNLLVLALIAGLAAWIAPSLFGYSRYVITGPSMTGTHDKGSVVFEKAVPVADLRVGDVITYLPPPDSGVPNLVTHRITAMEPAEGGGTVLTTKGDANPTPDPWLFQLVDDEQPVVQFSVPHAGWAFIALAHREVRMLLIGVPAALIALFALFELVGAVRDSRRRDLPGASARPVASL
jgi:signal peptidase I